MSCAAAASPSADAQPEKVAAQEHGASASQPREPPGEPDFVVQGRRLGELRLELRRAEEAVYARFNDINSDDRFDVHCRTEKRYRSHLLERRCQSNSWREQDANIGEATTRLFQATGGVRR